MTPTDTIISLEKALEAGPTAGSWQVYLQPVTNVAYAIAELSQLVLGSDFRPTLPMVVGGDKGLCTATTGCGPTSEANAQWIAACSPLAIRTLLDAHASSLRDAEKLREALKKIAAIEDCYSGTDWQEIEEAREIAQAALTINTKETE